MKREDCVGRHWLPCRDIPNAEAFEIDWGSVLLDQHDRAGKLSGCDFILEKFGHALKSGG
jgi:hypothetical protein